jgi:uncharacterized protein (DUF2345 family)
MRDHQVCRIRLLIPLILLTMVAAGRAAATPLADGLAGLPVAGQGAISGALGREDADYHALPSGRGYRLANPAHGLAAEATDAGVTVEAGPSRWSLRLEGWGYGGKLQPVEPAAPRAEGNRVEYRHGATTEWYVNGPFGLQQGFTLETPPATERSGLREALTLQLTQSGDLDLTLDEDRRGLTLARAGGGPAVLRYRGLSAYDAAGRELPAWLELQGRSLLLRVDDRGAVYPVVVDPLLEQAKLTASDRGSGDKLGISVSVSGDTIVVGAINASSPSFHGAAYVFVKPVSGWVTTSTFAAKLTAFDGQTGDQFGTSVSVNGDTILVGAPYNDSGLINAGSAYVFVKPVSGWATTSFYTAKLTASDRAGSDYFGSSVALQPIEDHGNEGDNTAVIGAPGAGSSKGAAYVFVKPGSGWVTTTFAAKLTASDGLANDQFGKAVAVGRATVAIGAPLADVLATPPPGARIDQGAVYVFVKPGFFGDWVSTSTFAAKLTASDGQAFDQFGYSVAAQNYDTVVVGAPFDDVATSTSEGSAYVFVRPASGSFPYWTSTSAFTAKLTASDHIQGDLFGTSVAVSGDKVVVGATHSGATAEGAAYVFARPVCCWLTTSTFTEKLKASDAATADEAGASVALSGDTVVVGAPIDDTSRGSAYVYNVIPRIDVLGVTFIVLDLAYPELPTRRQLEFRLRTDFVFDIAARLTRSAIRGAACLVTLTVLDPNGVAVIDHEPLDLDARHLQLQHPVEGLWTTQVEASAQCTAPQEYELFLEGITTVGPPPTLQLAGIALLLALGTLLLTTKRRGAGARLP